MKSICGIYKITSPTGAIYIGQSVNIKNRWALYKNGHCKDQRRLFNSLKKHGVENHTFDVVEECDRECLNSLETHYIQVFDTFNTSHGMNLRTGGGQRVIISDETRLILKKALKGKNLGKKPTKETLAKMSAAQIGRKHSKKTIEKIVMSRAGYKHSDNTKEKISNRHKGRKFTEKRLIQHSKVTKKIWEQRRKKGTDKHTPESRQKMSKAQTGKKKTEESIKKYSESIKKNWGKRKSSPEFNSEEEKKKRSDSRT